MNVEGSCHCGDVRFEARVDPRRVGICHCTDCQVFSGSAFRTSVLVSDRNFRLVEGEPASYEKTAESGAARELVFCGRCGTHLYGVGSGEGGAHYSLRVGVLAQRVELPPVLQVWCQSEMPWLSRLSSLRKVERQ